MFPRRLTEIDDLTRKDHYYLDPEDDCFYLGEYTARQGFAFSDTNQLILNLKKKPDRKGRPEWRYKEQAIVNVGRALRQNFKEDWLTTVPTLVPIPPSKAKTDPMYDDRILRVLQVMGEGLNLDIREIVLQRESTAAAHEQDDRPTPADLIANYYIDENMAAPPPSYVAVFDDLLTAGSHFKAVKQLLLDRYPDVAVGGFFIARRVPDTSEVEDITFDDLST